MKILLLSLFLNINLYAKVASQAIPYTIDTGHASLEFKVKHMMISDVKGIFKAFHGDFYFDKKSGDLENINITIDSKSIFTNDIKRDEHLIGADFLNGEKFSTMNFVSKKVTKKGSKPVKIDGEFEMLSVKKPLSLSVEYMGSYKSLTGTENVAFKGKGKLNRKDFGITFNKILDAGGVAIGDVVDFTFEFEAVPSNKIFTP